MIQDIMPFSTTPASLVLLLLLIVVTHSTRCLVVGLSTSLTPTPQTNVVLQESSSSTTKSGWISPHESFRDTISGELSFVSLNCLAPSLFGLDPEIDEDHDRMTRLPKAIELATRLNADVLCLQEIEQEGTTTTTVTTKEEFLSLKHLLDGYDYQWVPLHPKRRDTEKVGLCVAWKPDRFSVVTYRNFARGMVVQLQQQKDGSRICIGNLHLPARPAAIAGRLHTISNLMRNIQSIDTRLTTKIPLDGSVIIGGDLNGDASSVAFRLLQNGYIKPGNIMDRNYRMKITKADAMGFQHDFRFQNIYQGVKHHLTVSLKGRGPGVMDHILYAQRRPSNNNQVNDSDLLVEQSVRQKRRKRGQAKTVIPMQDSDLLNKDRLVVETRLETLDGNETRTQIIEAGLPTPEFPSDHLPVGALFVPNSDSLDDETNALAAPMEIKLDAHDTRQRHDTLLRSVTSWLTDRGATDIIQDKTLYEWKWMEGMEKQTLRNKMRAPDICFVSKKKNDHQKLIMIEVTAVRQNRTSRARKQKQLKYHDLALALSRAPAVQKASLQVLEPIIIVVPADGDLPEETHTTLAALGDEVGASPEETNELALDLIRVRNHWT